MLQRNEALVIQRTEPTNTHICFFKFLCFKKLDSFAVRILLTIESNVYENKETKLYKLSLPVITTQRKNGIFGQYFALIFNWYISS